MIFKSKQTVNGNPIWMVDTDTQTVQHINPRTGETESHTFHTDQIKYYLHHIDDKGEIYKHLDELDIKVTDTVNRQTELLMESSRDFQIANEMGDLKKVGEIGNMLRMQAKNMVFDTMVYLWRNE